MTGGKRGNRAVRLVVQVAAFAVLGVLLVTVGSGRTDTSKAFRDTPRFVVWAALMAVQVASWPVLFRIGRDRLRDLAAYDLPRRTRSELARLGALGLLIFLFWLGPQLIDDRPDAGLSGHGARIGLAVLGGYVAVTPCLLAIWRTHDALSAVVDDRASAVAMFERLNPLRSVFTGALTAVGVLVTEAALATGALRGALIQSKRATADDFPAEFVLLYGGFFTALLAAAAAPTYGRLSRRSAAVVDVLLPVLPPPEAGWRDRLAERRDLAGHLRADTTVQQTFQTAVLVAGPLLTGLISLLVPTKG